jgi:histone H3/H4
LYKKKVKEVINMADALVVGSKVKEAIKSAGCNTAGDVVDGLSAKVAEMVKDACERAKANGRKTVRAIDF